MKIAAVIYKFFPYGGIQLDMLRIIEECNKRGHEVAVFTHKWEGECPGYVKLHLIPLSAAGNHSRMAEFDRKVNALLPEENADAVFGVNRISGLDAYFAGDTCYTAKAFATRSWLYRLMPRYRTYHRLEKAVFAPEANCKIMLLVPGQEAEFKQYFNTPDDRFMLLPPGIPADRCRTDNAGEIRKRKRMEFNLAKDDVMLLQIGSGFITKGVERSIRALAELPSAWRSKTRFFVVGADNPAKFIKLAEKLNVADKVEFLGGRNDVPQLLMAADLMLHPAINDATATVLAEAIVAGLPVICTKVCGFSTLIKQANSGIVLPEPFCQAELNRNLEKVLEAPGMLQAYQDNAIMYADKADFFRRQQVAADALEEIAKRKQK